MLADLIRLTRPKQFTKNLLVFAGMVFGGAFTREAAVTTTLAFLGMCILSAGVYVLNDVKDADADRSHPVKRERPVASGRVPIGLALTLGLLLCALGMAAAVWLGRGPTIIVAAYLALQIAYNGGLKHVAVADVFCVSAGFVLRAAFGAAALQIRVSAWLLLCTGALALMLCFAKRRHEFLLLGGERTSSRRSLAHYSLKALDAFVLVFATSAMLSYGVYAVESDTAHAHPSLFLTLPFVVYGTTRYLLLVFANDEGGEPADVLFRDPHIIFSVVGFIAVGVAAMMGLPMPVVGR